jgi:hypothetical protein
VVDLPAEVVLGKVVGLFLVAVTDSDDVGTAPDAQPETGTIKFVPKLTTQRVLAPELMTIINRGVISTLNVDGRIVDAQGAVGLWLVAGTYDVTFTLKNSKILPMTITVTEAHTELTPLDLALAIPPPGPVIDQGQYAELSLRIDAVSVGGGVTDHGLLTGLLDDDHTQYALADGTRGSFATVAQGALADTAVQPAALAAYATDAELAAGLATKATTAQGALADTAVQPAALAAYATDAELAAGLATKAPTLGVDDNYVTDAEKVKLTNLSGTNTGDQTLPTWSTISGKPAVIAEGATQAAARTAIGAGTSSLVIGTGAGDAKAGNYQPAAANISDSTVTGRALITAVDAAAARTTLALGTAATTASTAYATAAQGTLAGTASQPGHVHAGTDITTGTVAAARLPAASDTASGIVELATTAETTTGTDTTRAVTAAGVKAVADTKAAASHTHAAADVTSGTLAVGRIGSGTPAASTYVDGGTGAWTALPGGGGSAHTIEDEGSALTARTSLNFVGAGVTATDSGSKTVVTIPGADPWTYVVATAATTNSTTTASNCTGLSLSGLANGLYEFEAIIRGTSAATTCGVQVGLAWGASAEPAAFIWGMGTSGAAQTFQQTNINGAANSVAATGTGNTTDSLMVARIVGSFRAATMTHDIWVTVKSEVAATQVSVDADSFIRYRKIAN